MMGQSPVRLFPFGGVGEFGKNMMVYAMGHDAIAVDCGMGFPQPGQHGVDVVIPDISALDDLGLKLHGIVLTHGHEDHIGALPYLLPRLNIPVFGTEMTLGLIRGKMENVKGFSPEFVPLPDNDQIELGPFTVEAVPVTHSIMDAVSIAIHTPNGIIIHTGDFKFDPAPLDGRATALHRFAVLGDQGVLLLASDSTNAVRSGSSPSERSVGPGLKQAIQDCGGRVVVTTFSSNMFRIQQIIDAAVACGRKIALAGRSLERNFDIASGLNRLRMPAGYKLNMKQAGKLPAHEVLVIATGSQGESRAAMARIAQDRFSGFMLGPGDVVVFSSSMIPGNEQLINEMINHIYRRGARVIHAGQAPIHVSGHGQAHELKTMIQLTRPRYVYPVHGEYRNLIEHKHLARAAGIEDECIVIAENGQSVEVDGDGVRLGEVFPAGAVYVDGEHWGEVDNVVLRDRRQLAEDGIVTVITLLSRQDGKLLGEPELVTRGVLHAEVSEEVLAEASRELHAYLESVGQEMLSDIEAATEEVRVWMRRWFRRRIGRRPIVLPIMLEV